VQAAPAKSGNPDITLNEVGALDALITIEHIYPQNPSEKWQNELSREELNTFKEYKLNTIANLTLSGNNGLLSNKSFSEKSEMNKDGGEQGYKYSRLWLNVYLNQIDAWNLENYEERFGIIYNRFLDIWEYPDLVLPQSDDSSEQIIFDAESPKHQKLEYFIFENTKVEEDTISQMYFHVLGKLFEKNPELLLSNDIGLKITRNSEDFRSPQELINGYHIEANMDSTSKFSLLKRVLTLFEMEDELSIKYDDGEGSLPNRFILRKKFWTMLLPKLHEVTSLYDNVSANKDSWLQAGAGVSGITYLCAATKNGVRVELVISTSNKETNKNYFHQLERNKAEIEKRFGGSLNWQELPEYKLSAITKAHTELSMYNESDWPQMIDFFCKQIPKLNEAFGESVLRLR
jgi:hypothetical protein